ANGRGAGAAGGPGTLGGATGADAGGTPGGATGGGTGGATGAATGIGGTVVLPAGPGGGLDGICAAVLRGNGALAVAGGPNSLVISGCTRGRAPRRASRPVCLMNTSFRSARQNSSQRTLSRPIMRIGNGKFFHAGSRNTWRKTFSSTTLLMGCPTMPCMALSRKLRQYWS